MNMKLWKVALILLAIAVVAAGYGTVLVRRGFSARGTPSSIEKFAAATALKLAVPSKYRGLPNPFSASLENLSEDRDSVSERFSLCSVEPFVFTHRTKVNEIEDAFRRWLDAALAVAVKEYGDQL